MNDEKMNSDVEMIVWEVYVRYQNIPMLLLFIRSVKHGFILTDYSLYLVCITVTLGNIFSLFSSKYVKNSTEKN
jgi:hypothetical protein